MAESDGTVRVVLELPSWDDYLRTALNDLLESASRSSMVLLRARTLLTTLLEAPPPTRQPLIARRLHRAEELGGGNFPVIWHDAAGAAAGPARQLTSHPRSLIGMTRPPGTCPSATTCSRQ